MITIGRVIVGLTGFASGLALYLAWEEVVRAIREHSAWPLAYTLTRLGFVVMIMLVAEAVFHAPKIPLTWRTVTYIIGALCVSVGYVFVALDQRRRSRRWTDKRLQQEEG